MRTYSAKPGDIKPDWFIIDAEGLVLGRLAVFVANRLRGKHKPMYTPHMDCGDHIVIVNAEKVVLTGGKASKKFYYRHTGYPGGLKEARADAVLEGRFPERVIEKAVTRMVPKGPLGRRQLGKLHIYKGGEHPHENHKPVAIDLAELNRKNALTGSVEAEASNG